MKSFPTMEDYKRAVLALAKVEPIEGEDSYFADIPGFDGVWADGKTKAAALRELASVLDGWIELRSEHNLGLPPVGKVKPPAIHFA